MKKLSSMYIMSATVLGCFCLLPSAHADCAITGTTGSGGDVVVCSGSDVDGYDGTPNGDDVTVPAGATVDNPSIDTIVLNDGDDVILISGGVITSGSDALETGNGDDTVTITSGSLVGDSDGIRLQDGNDTLTITGGTITATSDQGIEAGSGNDFISISNAVITGDPAIEGEEGDDVVELGDNATVNGLIEGHPFSRGIGGGPPGNDILRFSMTVPPANVASVKSALAAADPNSGNITINGETYTWTNFAAIEDNIKGLAAEPANVPTLQFWGILILLGLMVLITQQTVRKVHKS